MSYTSITLDQFTIDIARALSDPTYVYWGEIEIHLTILESLTLWGALTSKWVERGTFPTAPSTPFYDLNVQLPTLRPRTLTYNQLCAELQYHLLESPTGSAGTGMTAQFNINNLLAALLNARNRFCYENGVPVQILSPNLDLSTPTASGIVDLPDNVALIARLAWVTSNSLISRLRQIDPYQAQSANSMWPQSPGLPIAYSTIEQSGTTVQLIPPPVDAGALSLLHVSNQTSTAGTLAMPNELAHSAKYLALYYLLSTSGPSYDPIRAKYALERYAQYDNIAQFRCITSVRINNTPASVSTLDDFDSASPVWQSITGRPTDAAVTYDLLALRKVPNSSNFSVSVDVVRTAPLPSAGTDYLDIGSEDLPYLFDFCRHLLSFKLGGSDFLSTLPLYDNFIRGAQKRNSLNRAKARYLSPLFDQPNIQDSQTPPT